MARKPKRPPRSPAIRARRPIASRPRTAPPLPPVLDLHRCEQFLVHEARLLDEGKFDDWLALFTADAWYWVPSEPDQLDPQQTVSLIYDDRRLLETRVRRLASPRMYSQEPRSRTSRSGTQDRVRLRAEPTARSLAGRAHRKSAACSR